MRRKEARYQVVWSSSDGVGLTVTTVQFSAILVMISGKNYLFRGGLSSCFV